MVKIDLYKGDCLEVMDELIAKGIVVDAIITDPPYGTTACKWDSVIDFDEMWLRLNKLIKPNGAIVLFGSEPFSSALRMSNIKNYKYDWIWKKSRPTGGMLAKKRPLLDIENISVFYIRSCLYNIQGIKECYITHINTEGRKKGSGVRGADRKQDSYVQTKTNYPRRILEFNSPHNVGAFHPTQKPVALMEYLINTYTNEKEIVLDFTMGSGTTGVACKNLNREFIGIELDQEYFEIAKERMEQ
jgi:DNA modification methylase